MSRAEDGPADFAGKLPSPWRIEAWEPGRRIVLAKGWSARTVLAGVPWLLPLAVPPLALLFPEQARPFAAEFGGDARMVALGTLLFALFPAAVGAGWVASGRPRRSVVDWVEGVASDGQRSVPLGAVERIELKGVVIGGDSDIVHDRTVPAQRSYHLTLESRGAPALQLVKVPVTFLELESAHDALVPLAESLARALGVPCRIHPRL
jgi:hypothetical protein